ncbi:hypothetical protein SYNTR_1532 [Candidatus Syntrophocurvum alkaliphilum]|uniref:Nudix hydrolase domain-containing protein n=1 Tax=Candidatus Syntrophocurvum alkaliphilum TaxID=2293317 RepID=A0A6I6DBY5_9FIRM|nr:NUDIX hydrolase [Candidatus Syntrophocurvum alkaliphilum]QGU00126.1 hypothetical protein SYNTR_1532 [Candidatus Syntrophocurvum alkaliphilum]
MTGFVFCPFCNDPLNKGIIDNYERNYCSSCSYVHYIYPIPATAAIGQLENKILLIKRGMEPGKGVWTFPSGFMEAGETPEESCLRELFEETGMEGESLKLINAYHEYSQMYGDLLLLVYHVILKPGIPYPGDDADETELVPIDDITDLKFRCFNLAFKELKKPNNI